MKNIDIAVIEYPSVSKSAVYGFVEMIELANSICHQLSANVEFTTNVLTLSELSLEEKVDVIVLLPCISGDFYTKKNDILNQYLSTMHHSGAILASACVGAFILAHGGFLDDKFCTTHWRLSEQFSAAFPKAKLNENAIIVNESKVITAGGRMAWLDLAFEIISSLSSPAISTALSKEMVIDNGYREQRFYSQFVPQLTHGDDLIKKVQDDLREHFSTQLSVSELADRYFVSTRTLQRRFIKATGFSVIEYLQKTRLHNACQLIELTPKSIEEIAYAVGYLNANAFRKIFYREYGLTPMEFRKRFASI